MCATTSSFSSARTDERRRNPRLRASSLIYAQLGSDNGGIVVNLGLDGMACHAAQHLIADKNSALSLRLRGSGLNAEITGELVWLGATQKVVGISFKNLSANVQQSLADWIVRESQPIEIAGLEPGPRQKTISAIAELAVPEKKTIPRSLSAALALSRAMATNHASPALEDVNTSDPSVRVDSSPGILPLAPTLETFPAMEYSSPAAKQLQDRVEDQVEVQLEGQGEVGESNFHIPVEFPEKNHLLDTHRITGPPPVNRLEHSQSEGTQEIIPPQKPPEIARDVPSQAPAKIRNLDEMGEITTAVGSTPAAPVSPALRPPPGARIAEKWIPPALISAWNGLNAQQKKLLSHIGTGCIGAMIGLMLVLAVTHFHRSSGQSSGSASQQKATIPPISPDLKTGDFHDAQNQGAAAQPTIISTAHPQYHPPQTSMLSKIANSILGNDSDGNHKISDYQMGLEVWTSQSSGYYYCSDDPYAKQVQDGSPMLQGDALQAGYRPRLGQFCN